ncbi:MAG: transcription termination factor Rho [Planctomycetota bacterium]|nr:transcription termination factor Rho [Planctomycetota bacterium]MDA1212157.1 transcription termination factor Rho [Planctomycetota bacterium]
MTEKSAGTPVRKTRRRRTANETTPGDTGESKAVANSKTAAADESRQSADEPKAEGENKKPAVKRTTRTRRRAEAPADGAETAPVSIEGGPATSSVESRESNARAASEETGTEQRSAQNSGEGGRQPGEGGGGGGGGGDEGGQRRRRRRRRRRGGGGGGGGGGGSNAGGERRGNNGGGRHRDGSGSHSGQQRRNRSQVSQTRTSGQNGQDVIGDIEGILELHPKGYGFLRDPKANYVAQDSDSFVSSSLIERHRLREGILIKGEVGPGTKGQGPRLKSIETIDGRTIEEYQAIRNFDELTPVNPFEQIKLETGPTPITMRVMDLLTPIGKGQRALIVAPPRTGKTMLLQDIADAVIENHPEMHLIVLLIDERPEEVTEMQRRIKGEVIASSMDRDVESHVRISQLIFERAKRIAESGGEVFILLDSITRTARAFNKWIGNTGRTMSGGLDVKAMDIPKKMFGTARRFDEGGSLTVAATALIDTGSRMDEVIFQEFKGTGNMEMVLSRELADRRIWPSIDITMSGTRREEKILSPDVLEGVTLLRRSLISMKPVEAMEQLTRTLERFKSNAEFLTKIRNIL